MSYEGAFYQKEVLRVRPNLLMNFNCWAFSEEVIDCTAWKLLEFKVKWLVYKIGDMYGARTTSISRFF